MLVVLLTYSYDRCTGCDQLVLTWCVWLQDVPTQSFYAVFDGHGGVNAALYASCHLPTNLVRDPCFPDDVAAATKRAYALTDDRFTARARTAVRDLQTELYINIS